MNQNSAIIATLLKETPKPIFVLGAGASVTSGIPLASEIVSKAAKWAFARQNGKDPADPRITTSDWYPWLVQNHKWFKEGAPMGDQYPQAVENLLLPKKSRKEFWVNLLNPDVRPSIGYVRLVELLHLKKISTVLTTNFDECIKKARNEINRPHHIDEVKTPSEYIKISATPSFPLLVYLHGDVNNYSDKNIIDEISTLDPNLVQRLIPLLKDHPLVVIGYRGWEPSIMEHLFLNNLEAVENFKNGIYWCVRKGQGIDQATDYVKTLASKIGTNFQFVEIESFDILFDKVIWSHIEDQKTKIELDRSVPLNGHEAPKITVFDLKPEITYHDANLDEVLVRSRIEKYCGRLKIAIPDKIDDNWVKNQMLNLNLIRKDKDGNFFVTNAGLLLFSKNPQKFFPHAKTIVRFSGSENWLRKLFNDPTITGTTYEQVAAGNLWSQLDFINDALALVNRPFRLKEGESIDVNPYDPIALKEVIVNSLVHRDYELTSANILEITPHTIHLKNPGGLTDDVKHYFEDHQMLEEVKSGRRGIKGYRNSVIADLFYGGGNMDKRGSGLSDVINLVNRNSGYVNFAPNLANTEFSVEMQSRPESVDETTSTATPLNVITAKFTSNIIPFVRLPEYVFRAIPTVQSRKELFELYPNIKFPPFEFFEKELYTLSNLNMKTNTLRNGVEVSSISSLALDEYQALTDGERRFIKLLNESVKSHFFKMGLIVDQEKRRAYFPRTTEGEKVITYQARLKKATRTLVKPRLAANSEKVKYWEHKAFYFAVKKFGNEYGLIIEPTYVFTLDGYKTLLASKRVGALATKKASRDYNLNVLNDTVFWMWSISNSSQESFRLKTAGEENFGDNLFLSAKYLEADLNYVEYIEGDIEQEQDVTDEELENEIARLVDLQREGKLQDEEKDEDLSDEDESESSDEKNDDIY